MGSLVGPPGAGIEILGSYDKLADLIIDHPRGNQGDVYAVDGILYFWNDETSEWEPIENLHGPTGPTGPEASSFTIIPFASQQAPYVSANANGKSTSVALLGYGYMEYSPLSANAHVAINIDQSDGSFLLTSTPNRQLAFSVPFNMKLNSIYITVGNWERFSLPTAGSKVFPYVQVYAAAAGTNTFRPLDNAFAIPTEGIDATSAAPSTMLSAEKNGLDIELPAGTRIAIGGLMEVTGETSAKNYYLYFTGGIGLSRWVRQ